jgi:hypothetical protein
MYDNNLHVAYDLAIDVCDLNYVLG